MARAVEASVAFLLSRDPAVADYPMGWGNTKPNGSWFRLGFPSGYVTDVLQVLEALVAAGGGRDPRLANAVDLAARAAGRPGALDEPLRLLREDVGRRRRAQCAQPLGHPASLPRAARRRLTHAHPPSLRVLRRRRRRVLRDPAIRLSFPARRAGDAPYVVPGR